MVQYCGRRAVQ
ncbi:hypothetical protein LINGRAHAP2_LOCUS31965 [Linum grandiflorum]